MRKAKIVQGPSIGTLAGATIPVWIQTRGWYWTYDRVAIIDNDGGVDFAQLAPDEMLLPPGLIYKKATQRD